MTPHVQREPERRRGELLDPPQWAARARRRYSPVKPKGQRRVRRSDPLLSLDLTIDHLEAADYLRVLAETPETAPQAAAARATLVDLLQRVRNHVGDAALVSAWAVVVERRPASRAGGRWHVEAVLDRLAELIKMPYLDSKNT